MTAITAVTAQNTVEVIRVYQIPSEMILAQVEAVVEDIGVDAVKVGMLANREVIDAVDRALEMVAGAAVVLDPVMVSESGARLLEQDAVAALIEKLVPKATVVTPNIPEAHELAGLGEEATVKELARAVYKLGPKAVVVTGGHGEGSADDLFFDGELIEPITGPMLASSTTHGSGCTHSSALAAYLARGDSLLDASRKAKEIASEAVSQGLEEIGKGAGPVDSLGIRYR